MKEVVANGQKKEASTDDLERFRNDLKKMAPHVLADEIPPDGVDIAFFHGRSAGDEGDLIPYMVREYRQGNIRAILIPGSDGQGWSKEPAEEVYKKGKGKYAATPGRAGFAQQFDTAGINLAKTRDGEEADRVYYTGPAVRHTGEEVKSIIEFILNNPDLDINSVGLVAHPHQLPRAFALMVHAIKDHEDPRIRDLKVYPAHPQKTNWDEIVPGSQGKNHIPRKDHASSEILGIHKGINTYHNAAISQDVIKYMQKRDGGPRMQRLIEQKTNDPHYQADLKVVRDAISMFTL